MTSGELVAHMHRTIGRIAAMLEWQPGEDGESGDYAAALQRVLLFLQVDTTEEVEDGLLLLDVAEQEVWRAVVSATVGWYNMRSADGETRERSKVHEQAVLALNRAERAVFERTGTASVRLTTLRRRDPYQRDDSRRFARGMWWREGRNQ